MIKHCPICNDKRHIFEAGKGWVRCKCVDQLRADRLMAVSGFPESLCNIESESFIPGDSVDRKKLAAGIASMVKTYDKKPVFIYSQGIDKDKVAAIISRYLSILHPEIESIAFANLDSLVKQQFGKIPEESVIPVEKLCSVDVLTLSIGKEITNRAHQNLLYSILYDRILANKFTIVSSFIPKNRVVQVYHEAVDKLMAAHFLFYQC